MALYGVEKRPRYPVCQCRLADPLGSADQPGVVKATLAKPLEKSGFTLPVPEEGKLLSRMKGILEPVRFAPGEITRIEDSTGFSATSLGRVPILSRTISATSSGILTAGTMSYDLFASADNKQELPSELEPELCSR